MCFDVLTLSMDANSDASALLMFLVEKVSWGGVWVKNDRQVCGETIVCVLDDLKILTITILCFLYKSNVCLVTIYVIVLVLL